MVGHGVLVADMVYFVIGDQPNDIEKQIRGLLMDYITKPNR